MLVLSLDLGKYNSMACLMDSEIREPQFLTIATDRHYLGTLLSKHQPDLVVMEACGPSGWICDLCRELKLPTLVCSTNDEAWQWRNVKRKTDRDDALKLARLALMGELSPVHIPEPLIRERRALIKYRKTLDYRINRIKNSIRSHFANRGIAIDTGKRAWCTGRVHIDSYRKPLQECTADQLWLGTLDLELTQLDQLASLLKNVEQRLDQIAQECSHTQRLMTIPGVGRKTAEALVTTIDDPHRFKNFRQLSSYLGLVPKQYQSGQTDRNGHITKRGSRLLRTILVECSWCTLRYNQWAKQTYESIHGGQRTRKKKAAVALARKIAVVAWAMMRDEINWDATRCGLEGSGAIKVHQQPNRPPGPVHAEKPKFTSGSRKKSTRRRRPVTT